MRAGSISLVAGALCLAAMPTLASAAPARKAAAKPAAAAARTVPPAGDTAEEHAILYLKVIISALQSEQVPEPIKGALVSCLYANSLGKITESVDKAIAANADKIKRDNPSELLGVMAQICGYQPQPGDAPSAATPPTTGTTPQGR